MTRTLPEKTGWRRLLPSGRSGTGHDGPSAVLSGKPGPAATRLRVATGTADPGHDPAAHGCIAPIDVRAELCSYVATLTGDEGTAFASAISRIELGEPIWSFTGRAREQRMIATWLRRRGAGMLVVTGEAGAGKSALLANVLCHTDPALNTPLTAAGWLAPVEEASRPPVAEFTTALHLAGLTVSTTVDRIAEVTNLGVPPGHVEPSRAVDWLIDRLRDRRPPVTLLLDGLDESAEPMAIAGCVLRRIASLPHSRVVVGTRPSTLGDAERAAHPNENLLDTLGRSTSVVIVRVEPDFDAVARFARLRLNDARVGGLDIDDADITAVSDLIGQHSLGYLFARLAIVEVLAHPELLTPRYRDELTHALSGGVPGLFHRAVRRLTAVSAAAGPLLSALAIAGGRGLPRAGAVWSTVATALAADGHASTEQDIDWLLDAAAPYIMRDVEDGQPVYRLAHRSLREHWPVPF